MAFLHCKVCHIFGEEDIVAEELANFGASFEDIGERAQEILPVDI